MLEQVLEQERALVQVQVLEAAKVTDPETVLELEQALDRALG